MLAAVSGKGSERLWRLYAVACVRGVEPQLRDERSRKALWVAERFADGRATRQALRAAREQAEAAEQQAHYDAWIDEVRVNFCSDAAYESVCAAWHAAAAVLPCVAEDIDIRAIPSGLQLPSILREIFGNPFQWKSADPNWLAWNAGAVRSMAQMVYDNDSFQLLPILADMLEEAGCTDFDVLRHFRNLDCHVRGCWALDLLLDQA